MLKEQNPNKQKFNLHGKGGNSMTDKELKKVVSGFTKGFIGKGTAQSKCFVLCFPLQSFLNLCGVETELIEGEVEGEKFVWGHYWLKLKDGRIIDPTCDQFNIPGGLSMPKVYIGEKPESYKLKETI